MYIDVLLHGAVQHFCMVMATCKASTEGIPSICRRALGWKRMKRALSRTVLRHGLCIAQCCRATSESGPVGPLDMCWVPEMTGMHHHFSSIIMMLHKQLQAARLRFHAVQFIPARHHNADAHSKCCRATTAKRFWHALL